MADDSLHASTRHPMTPRLPPELVNYVAAYLHDNKQALCAGAGVCRAWLASFRGPLFRDIRADGLDQDRSEEFVEFLEDTPSICPLIVRLRLKGIVPRYCLGKIIPLLPHLSTLTLKGWSHETSDDVEAEVTFGSFRLETLFFDIDRGRVRWGDPDDSGGGEERVGPGTGPRDGNATRGPEFAPANQDAPNDAPGAFPWIYGDVEDVDDSGDEGSEISERSSSESFSFVGFEDANIISRILRMFSHIRHLYINYDFGYDTWKLTPWNLEFLIPTAGFLEVETFCLAHIDAPPSMYGYFHRMLKTSSLRSISIMSADFPIYDQFRSILREANDLSYLGLAIGEPLSVYVPDLALDECPNLRTLYLQSHYSLWSNFVEDEALPDDDSDYGFRAVYEWPSIRGLITQNLPHLEHLVIGLFDHQGAIAPHLAYQAFQKIEWSWLEAYILKHYPNLQTLTLSYDLKFKKEALNRGVTEQKFRTYILEHLPKLVAKGVVRLEYVNPFFEGVFGWEDDETDTSGEGSGITGTDDEGSEEMGD